MLLKIYFVSAAIFIVHINSTPTSNFGKFNLEVAKMEQCVGPKRQDCCIWEIIIENKKIVHYNVTAKRDIKPLKVKIVVFSNNKELVRLQIKTVCEHIFLRPLFKTIVNITDNCIILKGRYTFDINMEEIIGKYYGGEFLYGNITFKSLLHNNDCNFACISLTVTLSPKKSK